MLCSCFLKRSNLQQNSLPSISTCHRLRDINGVTKCRKLWALTTSSERTLQLIKQRVAVGNNGFHTRVATHRKRRIGNCNPDSESLAQITGRLNYGSGNVHDVESPRHILFIDATLIEHCAVTFYLYNSIQQRTELSAPCVSLPPWGTAANYLPY